MVAGNAAGEAAAAESHAGPSSMSLPEAVTHAVERHPAIAVERQRLGEYEARLVDAGRWPNPGLEVAADSARLAGRSGEANYAVGLTQRFPVTDRLRRAGEVTAGEISLARGRLEILREGIALDAARAYLEVAAGHARLQLAKAGVEVAREQQAGLEERLRAGRASRAEVAVGQAELGRLEARLLRTSADLDQARLRFATAIGWDHARVPDCRQGLDDLARLLAGPGAVEARPRAEMHQANLAIDDAARRHALELARRWEDWEVRLFYEQERSGGTGGGLRDERFVGIGVAIPLPLWNRNRAAINEARERAVTRGRERDLLGWRIGQEQLQADSRVQLIEDARRQQEEKVLPGLARAEREVAEALQAEGGDPLHGFRVRRERLEAEADLLELEAMRVEALLEAAAAHNRIPGYQPVGAPGADTPPSGS